jgi:hypothetical protein
MQQVLSQNGVGSDGSLALDLFAMTNPAYTSLILYSFVEGFTSIEQAGAEVPLAFLPIPIAMSGSIAQCFAGTNIKTNLLDWVGRNPELQFDLARDIRDTKLFSRQALMFGLQSGILTLQETKLLPNEAGLKKKPTDAAGLTIAKRTFSVASRFGVWCGSMHSASLIFLSLGLQP